MGACLTERADADVGYAALMCSNPTCPDASCSIEYGLCHCGCGGVTTIAPQSVRRHGYIKGEPRRFIDGHHGRRSGIAHIPQDRGYTSPCWIWQRAKNQYGYGLSRDGQGSSTLAHRRLYEQARGPVPEGKQLDHLCRQRDCVNPDHLEPVTNQVNAQRGAQPVLSPDDVAWIRAKRTEGWTYVEMASALGVAKTTVRSVCNGKTWTNLEDTG